MRFASKHSSLYCFHISCTVGTNANTAPEGNTQAFDKAKLCDCGWMGANLQVAQILKHNFNLGEPLRVFQPIVLFCLARPKAK